MAHTIENERSREAARLLRATKDALSRAAPVRVKIAARLLVVDDKTVRAWAKQGLLTSKAEHPRLLLDPERLHEVLQFVRELRATGHNRDLLTNL